MREFNVSPPNLGGVPKSAVIQLVIESDFNKWILGRWLINLSLVGRMTTEAISFINSQFTYNMTLSLK